MISPSTGMAEFEIRYNAVVYKPYKNEVVDALVTSINNVSNQIQRRR